MTNKNESTIIEAGVTLTDAQKKSINEGVEWVRNWYQKRHEAGLFLDGADIGADVEEYKTAMENLDKLQIVATKDMYGTLEKMILEGKLHLKDEVIAQFDGDEKQAIAGMLTKLGMLNASGNDRWGAWQVGRILSNPTYIVA